MADAESIAASSQDAGDDPLNDKTDDELQQIWEDLA